MGLFDNDMLDAQGTLIKNENALEYDFIPKLIPHRENEQKYIATCIKPLFQDRTGRNLLIHGLPGIGKTVATKHVIDELEEKAEDIHIVYINCWKFNTTFKIICEICHQIGFRLTQNKNTNDLFQVVKNLVNKASAVFVFDEVDKVEDFDFLYLLIEEIYKKSILLITNYKSWLLELDERIKSRLVPELLEFKPYSEGEIVTILKDRLKFAFYDNAFPLEYIKPISKKTFDLKDIRSGLFLLKSSAQSAEMASRKTVNKEDLDKAFEKLEDFTSKNSAELEDEPKFILDIVQKNPGSKIGDLFRSYQKEGGKMSYKTFQRKLAWLEQNRFVSLKKQTDAKGNTTIVDKRLTDY